VNVTCQDCRSVFRVDPAKVPPNGVRARCSVCGAILRISVGATTPLTNPAMTPRSVTPMRSPSVGVSTPVSTPSMTPTAVPTIRQPTPFPAVAAMPTPTMPTVAIPTPSVAQPMPQVSAPTPTYDSRLLVPPPPPTPGELVAPSTMTTPLSVPMVATTSNVTPIGSDAKRVINPFLRSDPMTRAKRLARALVSDMVAYQPAKRSDGLANGTLKQLFRDEIRKSYDEYVEQVGREVAESTAFFQDALNEVLADGKRVF
jgi:predicted Zn finger-like uncharacterized protein